MTDKEKFADFFKSYGINCDSLETNQYNLPPGHTLLILNHEESGLLTVGTGYDYPPAFAFDKNGKLIGVGSIV